MAKKRKGIMTKRIIGILLLAIGSFMVFVSCGNAQLKKSATFYDDANEYITDNAKATYETGGADPDYKELPRKHTVLIKTQEEYNQILKDSSIECDFEQEMIVVHTFTTIVGTDCPGVLKSIKQNGNKIIIKCKIKGHKGYYTAATPWQRWFAIKMKKVDFESVEVQIV